MLFVSLAVLIASSAGETAQLMRVVIGRERGGRPLPAGSSLGEWLRLYRRHRQLANRLGAVFPGQTGVSATEAQAGPVIGASTSTAKPERERFCRPT